MSRKLKDLIKKGLRYSKTPFIIRDLLEFRKVHGSDGRFALNLKDIHPCPFDNTAWTGFDRHYVYHTSWAARVLSEQQPEKHIDISSSLYFNGIVSAFIPVEFYDYRPADLSLPGLACKKGDLMNLPFEADSVKSISCMHVVEHIGLGRYGDPIDARGDIKAAKELSRVLAPGGSLLFVVPIGKRALIEYNAHRIYSHQTVLNLFPDLTLKEFSIIPEKSGAIIRNADPKLLSNEHYACGCFVFTKK